MGEAVTGEMDEALADVVRAMDRLNKALETRTEDLRQQGTDEVILAKFIEGARAIRDSSSIYLTWADYIANGRGLLPGAGEGEEVAGEEE